MRGLERIVCVLLAHHAKVMWCHFVFLHFSRISCFFTYSIIIWVLPPPFPLLFSSLLFCSFFPKIYFLALSGCRWMCPAALCAEDRCGAVLLNAGDWWVNAEQSSFSLFSLLLLLVPPSIFSLYRPFFTTICSLFRPSFTTIYMFFLSLFQPSLPHLSNVSPFLSSTHRDKFHTPNPREHRPDVQAEGECQILCRCMRRIWCVNF